MTPGKQECRSYEIEDALFIASQYYQLLASIGIAWISQLSYQLVARSAHTSQSSVEYNKCSRISTCSIMVHVLFREYARREGFIPGRCIGISMSAVVSNKYYRYLHCKTKVRHAEFLKIGARERSGPPGLPAPPGQSRPSRALFPLWITTLTHGGQEFIASEDLLLFS